tara:strand:- start:238 stop:402 length:165 start_codon:yes stop_codon:yes gene_type:complete
MFKLLLIGYLTSQGIPRVHIKTRNGNNFSASNKKTIPSILIDFSLATNREMALS